MDAEDASGGQISYYVPHSEQNANLLFNPQFYGVVLKVPSIMV